MTDFSFPPDDIVNAMLRLDTMDEKPDDTRIIREYAEGLTGQMVIKYDRHPDRYTGIICRNHGKQGLTRDEYMA